MSKAIRVGRINRHEKVCQVMLSGKVLSPTEIRSVFVGTPMEKESYRLPQNICAIKADGCIVKVTKDGRKVTGYQLMNPQNFNAEGRYIQKPATSVVVEKKTIQESQSIAA